MNNEALKAQRKGLKELINEYPELGDVFAEFETRILRLENSMPNNTEPIPEQKVEITKVTQRVEDEQLGLLRRNLISYIDKKLKKNTRMVDKQIKIIEEEDA